MSRCQMKGRWTGEYSYDPIPELDGYLTAVAFLLEVEMEWEGKFRGYVQDDPKQGVPERGLVKGEINGETVSFEKQLPVFYWETPEGPRLLEDCVREWWDLHLDYAMPPAPIIYEGSFSPNGTLLEGKWFIRGETLVLPSKGQRYALDVPPVTGQWYARRIVRPSQETVPEEQGTES